MQWYVISVLHSLVQTQPRSQALSPFPPEEKEREPGNEVDANRLHNQSERALYDQNFCKTLWLWYPVIFVIFQDFEEVFILIRDIILATDLAHHLKILQDIKNMSEGELAGPLFQEHFNNMRRTVHIHLCMSCFLWSL